MLGLGTPGLVVILSIIFLLFGGKKLPEIGAGLGRAIRSFKNGLSEVEEATGMGRYCQMVACDPRGRSRAGEDRQGQRMLTRRYLKKSISMTFRSDNQSPEVLKPSKKSRSTFQRR